MRTNFSITASKETMATQEFIDIANCDKMMQEYYVAKHKQNVRSTYSKDMRIKDQRKKTNNQRKRKAKHY